MSLKTCSLAVRNCKGYLSFSDRFSRKYSSDGGPNVTLELEKPFKLYNLEKEPKTTAIISKKTAEDLYRQMMIIRRIESAASSLYRARIIRGFCHLYVGQEACCVGMKAAIRPQDTVISAYRVHGWTWIMGVSVYALIAELCQKQTGCSRGKGGSMHTYGPNFFGGNGIVGSQTSIGTGLAFAHAYRSSGGVSFTCYGDGAANQGQLHESFNMACLWKLPVAYVCENNQYGMGTAMKRSSCATDYYTRGDYIPGLWVNGNDVLAVRNATEFVIEHVTTCGPIVMELETYRYYGHSMSDPGTSYRSREEVEKMRRENDPITKFRELCIKNNIISEDEFKKINDEVKKQVDADVQKARNDPDTDPNELAIDIYAKNLEGNIRNVVERNLKHRDVGTRLVPEGVVKPTPKSEIREVPKTGTISANTLSTDFKTRKDNKRKGNSK